MTREECLAALIKLACALPVLRWPLAGALISIAADASDVLIMNYVDLGGGGIRDYHLFDKLTERTPSARPGRGARFSPS